MKPDVAVIGIGIMGSAIATRLLGTGHRVFAVDLDPARLTAIAASGALVAASPAAAMRAADFAITSLNTAAIVRAAVFGAGGLAEGAAPGKMVIDMSSIDPLATQAMAAELRERTGMAWVDAPLSGGAPRALEGRLTRDGGRGGRRRGARARRVMDSLCANYYTHMGPTGAGQTTKLVNQVLCALGFQAVAEAVRLAEAGGGVDASRIPEALAGGRADSAILREFGPQDGRARDFSLTGRISTTC